MSSKSKPHKPLDPSKMTYEEAIEELEGIIERIEEGKIALEESLAARKRGDALIKRCRTILDSAEQELKEVSAEDDMAR